MHHSHFLEPVEIPSQRKVDAFLPPYEPDHVLLSPKRVMHLSVMVSDQYFKEYRYQQQEAMERPKGLYRRLMRHSEKGSAKGTVASSSLIVWKMQRLPYSVWEASLDWQEWRSMI